MCVCVPTDLTNIGVGNVDLGKERGQEGTGQLKTAVESSRFFLDLPLEDRVEAARQPSVIWGARSHQINSFPRQLIDSTSLRRGYVRALSTVGGIRGSERYDRNALYRTAELNKQTDVRFAPLSLLRFHVSIRRPAKLRKERFHGVGKGTAIRLRPILSSLVSTQSACIIRERC